MKQWYCALPRPSSRSVTGSRSDFGPPQWRRHGHHHVVRRDRERYDVVDDRRDVVTGTPRAVRGRLVARLEHGGGDQHQRPVRHLPVGLGLLDLAGLQRRHRAHRVLRLILDPRPWCGAGRPIRSASCAHGARCLRSSGVRHPPREQASTRRGAVRAVVIAPGGDGAGRSRPDCGCPRPHFSGSTEHRLRPREHELRSGGVFSVSSWCSAVAAACGRVIARRMMGPQRLRMASVPAATVMCPTQATSARRPPFVISWRPYCRWGCGHAAAPSWSWCWPTP
jgi:hypothetical protein